MDEGPFDLIFTDPPYMRRYLHMYEDLAKFADSILSDTGSLVCYVGHYNLPDYLKLMLPYLDFWWVIVEIHQQKQHATPMVHRKVIPTYKPMLWFVKKGCKYTGKFIYDSVLSERPKKSYHPWEQSPVEATHVIGRLTEEGDKVIDPFMGSGTTGVAALSLKRRFVGIEKDYHSFKVASDRLSPLNKMGDN